ncbi:MAG: hypothetical protein WCA64_05715 [Gallionella sp.]
MNVVKGDPARNVDEAGILNSTLGWHATMTAMTTVATVLIIVAVAAWEIT